MLKAYFIREQFEIDLIIFTLKLIFNLPQRQYFTINKLE